MFNVPSALLGFSWTLSLTGWGKPPSNNIAFFIVQKAVSYLISSWLGQSANTCYVRRTPNTYVMYCLSDIMLFHTLQCVNPIGCGGRGATICELSQNLTPFRTISSGSAHACMLDYFDSRDYCHKSDLLRGKLDPSLHFPRTWNPGSNNLCHPETGDYHSPTLLCQSLPIFAWQIKCKSESGRARPPQFCSA